MNRLLTWLRPGALVLAAGLGGLNPSHAQTLDKVIEEGQQKVQANRESQERVNDLVAEKQQKLVRYRALLKQIEGLEQYNTQLRTQIQGQEALIARFDRSIAEVASIERQMLPLIHRMADSLAAYVHLDLPFHEAERLERLEFISKSVNRADLDIGEKFRQVIEAYQVESEYGRKIDTYTDIVTIDGREIEVDVLRFGRIALVAQSKDTAMTAVWNHSRSAWEKLDTGVYRNSIRRGILMAKKQASIDLITLPIAAPEVAQ